MNTDTALVIGASSTIAHALIEELLQHHTRRVIAISRQPPVTARDGVHYLGKAPGGSGSRRADASVSDQCGAAGFVAETFVTRAAPEYRLCAHGVQCTRWQHRRQS